jgi:hypothetical protein
MSAAGTRGAAGNGPPAPGRDGAARAEPAGYFLRQEAHPMSWGELFPPQQDAVEGLLLRMNAAAAAMDRKDEEALAPCFLIAGPRGTGKTTVLLNVKHALEPRSRFFEGVTPKGLRVDDVQKLGRRVVWLDTLDMEFFPERGNLLTALLVRVRSALGRSLEPGGRGRMAGEADGDDDGLSRRGSIPPQLLEEGVSDAWALIESLITNATLMWEGAAESSARVQAERQIDVAESSAAFREDFEKAIGAVTDRLYRAGQGTLASEIVLVLPIDNADRSVSRVSQVIKLVRMVSCRNLWYVLAGSDRDLDLFLERAYRTELGALADGEEAEKVAGIARSQAAADSRSALPPANQVRLDCVKQGEAFEFRRGEIEDNEPCLSAVLSGLKVSFDGMWEDETEEWSFLDLWNKRLPPGKLSVAGDCALQLPARTLVDLYQLARTWHARQGQLPDLRERPPALGLARDMVGNAVAESEMPEWARQLLAEIIFEDRGGKICLDLRGDPLGWRWQVKEEFRLTFPGRSTAGDEGARGVLARNAPRLLLYDYYGCKLFLRRETKKIELPDQVAGWLMTLYDILRSMPGPRIIQDIGPHPTREPPLLVQTSHSAPIWPMAKDRWLCPEILVTWPVPRLDNFCNYDLFAQRWRKFITDIDWSGPGVQGNAERCLLCLVAWIDIACSVFFRDEDWEAPAVRPDGGISREVVERGRRVIARVGCWYASHEPDACRSQRQKLFQQWIERDLFLLLQPELAWTAGLPEWMTGSAGAADEIGQSWRRSYPRLYTERWFMLREALEGSELAAHYRQRNADAELEEGLDQACDEWFNAIDEAAPGPGRPGDPRWAEVGEPAWRVGNGGFRSPVRRVEGTR